VGAVELRQRLLRRRSRPRRATALVWGLIKPVCTFASTIKPLNFNNKTFEFQQ
jgi:hypothetical protein